MHLRRSTRLRLLRTLKERILRWIGATDEAAIPKYCNEDEPQGAQKSPFRAGPFCFDLVSKAASRFFCGRLFRCLTLYFRHFVAASPTGEERDEETLPLHLPPCFGSFLCHSDRAKRAEESCIERNSGSEHGKKSLSPIRTAQDFSTRSLAVAPFLGRNDKDGLHFQRSFDSVASLAQGDR